MPSDSPHTSSSDKDPSEQQLRDANATTKNDTSQPKKKKRTAAEKEAAFKKRYLEELEQEKQAFLKKWKRENDRALATSTATTTTAPANRTISSRQSMTTTTSTAAAPTSFFSITSWTAWLATTELFLCNMPLTVAAVGLSWVTQGVVWFKFMEEVTDSCIPRRYNSDACSYPEFPGCFECDRSNPVYRTTLHFHYVCHLVGAVCCAACFAKTLLAWRVVMDELGNPATATPMGVVCITMVCVFAGRFGWVGQAIVVLTSLGHVILAVWFLYSAVVTFRLLPDPGWFPNTVGISYAAIKTWLYYPVAGKCLMVLAMILFFSTYFVSLYRVATNHKIAAPVCFIQLSAPSITMYAMTIMAQPSRLREQELEASPELMTRFQFVHRTLYLPVQHGMMILSLVGMVSVLHSLWARWPKMRKGSFAPNYVAFIFPLLSHANAVQAYRSGVNSFSNISPGSPFKIALFVYWSICLVVGTLVNLVFTAKYVKRLPRWTKVDVSGEEEPVAPADTMVHEMLVESQVHETMKDQQLMSPALLQANEAGTLVRVRRGSRDWRQHGPFVRSRRVTALGFDEPMSELELRQERAVLLDWVAKNAPRTRSRTLSIPMMMKLKDSDGKNLYGTFTVESSIAVDTTIRHKRSSTNLL